MAVRSSSSATSLTPEQRAALTPRGVSVALSAGAGCGKTFVLTERFLAQLAPQGGLLTAELSGVVAITFTDRAAREMRDRIRRKMRERIWDASADSEANYWLALERQLDAARISTIHAFCVALLRSHAIEAGLDPLFTVFDDKQTQALQAAIVERQLRLQLAERRPAAMEAVFHFGLHTTQDLLRQTLALRHEFDFEAWRGETADAILARWHQYFFESYRSAQIQAFLDHRTTRIVRRMAYGPPPGDDLMRSRCENLVQLFERLPTTADAIPILAAIRENAMIQGTCKDEDDTWSVEDYATFRDAAATLRKKIGDSLNERNRWEFRPELARQSAELGLHLLALAEETASAYSSAKQEAAALGFDDLLIRCRDLLCKPEHESLRRRISDQIELLLVDEFQDTDPLQVELVRALCGSSLAAGKLFFVGDLKQSIYRFRGARPDVFRALRESIPSGGRLPLTRNFRSQPAILHFVNALFCDALGPDYEPLTAHRRQVTAPPVVEFLWAPAEESEEDDSPRRPSKDLEAEWIARRLRGLINSATPLVYDTGADGQARARPVRPGDIAFVLRAMTDIEVYEAALRRHGLAYYVVGGHAFFAQQEVFDLMNLLRTLVSRIDEVSLAGVLRSPFFALADETLYWLAQHPKGLAVGLFAAELPGSLSAAERAKAAFAARTIAELRELKDRLPIAGVIQEALRLTGYDAVLTAEFLGERKLANLYKLIDQARAMDAAGTFTLHDYVGQLAEFIARQPKEPPAAILAEDANVVRLMTIHQAKGLEFPVVVIPNLDARAVQDTTKFQFDTDLGPLVRTNRDTGLVGLDMVRTVATEEDNRERNRLLYVAATRAADYLILSSSVKTLGEPVGPWMELLATRFDLVTGECLAELPTGFELPMIRVTTSAPECGDAPEPKSLRSHWEQVLPEVVRAAESGVGTIPAGAAPIAVDHASRRRYSFSRLSGELSVRDEEEPLAASVTQGTPGEATSQNAQGLGLLVHAVMEHISLADGESAEALVDLYAPQFLPDAPSDVRAAREMLRRFLDSPTPREMGRAATTYRELPFLLSWPIGAPASDSIVIEGVIDCLYQDASGAWRIVDYKTNRIPADGAGSLVRHYEPQLFLYAEAIKQAFGTARVSARLCFLQPGAEHEFTWNDADQRRLSAAIAQAIDRLRQGAPLDAA